VTQLQEEIMPTDVYVLPDNLPVPIDDGACDHLPGMRMPLIALASTAGGTLNLASLPRRSVIYAYPRTGHPDTDVPLGWNDIPGARGCTPQSCAFRDHHGELLALGTDVYGLSTQDTPYQQEVAGRLHLPFALLSDAGLELTRALRLPTFEVEGMTLLKRLTLVVDEGSIVKVFYPVFPPDANAANVIDWLQAQ
jgi:peroxiredoxin